MARVRRERGHGSVYRRLYPDGSVRWVAQTSDKARRTFATFDEAETYRVANAIVYDPAAAFWALVDKSGECWEWLGVTSPDGYGVFGRLGARTSAHRWAWSLSGRSEPGEKDIDHLCRNRSCVNPDHLQAISRQENGRKAMAFRWHGVSR